MRQPRLPLNRLSLAVLLIAFGTNFAAAAELRQHTAAAYEKYVRLTEERIDAELRSAKSGSQFLVTDFSPGGKARAVRASLISGEIHIERMRTLEHQREMKIDDGMIHHWMGAVFIPGVKLETLEKWLRNYGQHDQYFPEIEKSRLISGGGDVYKFYYRLKRHKVITVVYNTDHMATYSAITPTRLASRGVATRIAQLAGAGTRDEKELPVGNDGGYLWRLNSYWRFEEQNNGVFVECESLSLSRGIPFGVGWMIRGLVESVPRESLLNTLTAMRDGVRKATAQ